MTKSAKDLPGLIRAAFPSVALPAERVVPHANDPEYAMVGRDFAGKGWSEIPSAVVARHRDRLPFFSPEGFRAHLGGFLLAAIAGDADVAQGVVFSLYPPSKADLRSPFEARAKTLDAAQRAAVAAFLRWVIADQGADFPNGEPAAALQHWEKKA